MTKIDRHFLLLYEVICFTLYTREIARNHLLYFLACKCVIYFRMTYLIGPKRHKCLLQYYTVLLFYHWYAKLSFPKVCTFGFCYFVLAHFKPKQTDMYEGSQESPALSIKPASLACEIQTLFYVNLVKK